MSSPRVLTSAPPELPGLMAASVWIKLSMLLAPAPRVRAFAEIIPAVTVDVKLKGFPIASTHSPSFRSLLSPIVIAGRSSASTLMRARSVFLSVPIMRALNSRLSLSFTCNSSAPSTTWLLVTMYPSAEIITPLPAPLRSGLS